MTEKVFALIEKIFLGDRFWLQLSSIKNTRTTFTCFQQLLLADGLVAIVAMVRDVLQEVLVQRLGRREGRQAVGHQEPASLAVLLVVVLPGLKHDTVLDLAIVWANHK